MLSHEPLRGIQTNKSKQDEKMNQDRENEIRIKLCGLSRPCDIEEVNRLCPEYIGFVFAKKSSRYVAPEQAAELKRMLKPGILSVGVFVDEKPENIADLLAAGVIDIAQLHGRENQSYIGELRKLTDKPLVKAFAVRGEQDIRAACESSADFVLLDAGSGGTGKAFDWKFLAKMERPYFLAGGLDPLTVGEAAGRWRPYAVDVSSGIETDGYKDAQKMRAFVDAVRRVGSV